MNQSIYNILMVFFGAGFGGTLRFLFGRLAQSLWGISFPYGTLGVNIIGGFLMGVFGGYWLKSGSNSGFIQHFIMIGILGGFTTFSSFSLETLRMIEGGAYMNAAIYISASVIFSIFAVFIGMAIIKSIV